MIRRLFERLSAKIDGPLFALVTCLLVLGLATLYSAAFQAPGRVGAQALNVLLALVLMWIAAQVPPQVFMRYAVPAFVLVLVMLAGVALFGDVRNGARRWLPLGFASVQPSELMKVAMPLMLARYFHRHEAALRLREYVIAFALLAVPTAMIARQPDLGTALLVAAAGFYVIFLAGLSWKVIAGGSARAVLECAGIHDILSKSLGSSNSINVVHATVAALRSLETPEAVAARRGLTVEQVAPAALLKARAEAAS